MSKWINPSKRDVIFDPVNNKHIQPYNPSNKHTTSQQFVTKRPAQALIAHGRLIEIGDNDVITESTDQTSVTLGASLVEVPADDMFAEEPAPSTTEEVDDDPSTETSAFDKRRNKGKK